MCGAIKEDNMWSVEIGNQMGIKNLFKNLQKVL
jgi:hypothetical protein